MGKQQVMQKTKPVTGSDLVRLRNRLGLNQMQFWSPLGVTQSGGSRYESGRTMPRPLAILFNCVYRGGALPKISKPARE
jgi:DNA-binding transcriptional regulator YiaG